MPHPVDPDTDQYPVLDVTATDGRRVYFAAVGDPALRDDIARRPEVYAEPTDGRRVRLELWVDPWNWNEGFDLVREPVDIAFVYDPAEAKRVIDAITRVRHRWDHTGFKVKMVPAGSGAFVRMAAEVIADWTGWIKSDLPGMYIP